MDHAQTILVLARSQTPSSDPQLAMLADIPHIVGSDPAAFTDAAKDAPAILNWTGSRDLLSQVFAITPHLRWIHSRWAGVDGLLFPELVESSVILTNSRGVYSPPLGEFALAAMLYFAKDLPRMLRNKAAGLWAPFEVEEIARKTVAIAGYGDIGRAVATRARAMGMHILALKRHPPQSPDPLIDRFYKPDALHDMLALTDYLVVAAPLTPETHHMISDAAFAAMKPSAVVINVGRGPVIDNAALIRALTEKRIRGAGLDVVEDEPLPTGHPLYSFENVLLSPHCADNTPGWTDNAMRFFLEQYARFIKDEPLENIVNKRLGY
jgi:phosphoglycerate dehydrogenase-like enzyme